MIAKAKSAWHRGGLDLQKVCGELLLLASAFAMAISPIYVFEQYLGPLAFLLLLFSAPWNSADQASRRRYALLGLAMLCIQFMVLGQLISRYVTPDGNLQVVQVVRHKTEPGRSSAMAIDVSASSIRRSLYSCSRMT